ncbi:MAG: peroxiredoxin [Acidimicrobiales bacterium]
MIGVGDEAPNFVLEGVNGDGTGQRTFSLEEFRGAPVVLVFYPSDYSPVCTAQLRSYSDDMSSFASIGAQVLALSPQTIESHTEFAIENDGFGFPLLSDLEKSAAKAYGTLGPLGFYRRSVFVIAADGVVHWTRRAAAGLTFRPVDEIVAAVRSIGE